MSMISYAQNFEDVMLWRALAQVENGFYIDVGAQHPVIDSVSKAFYDKGWHGIHVEATPAYAALLREGRPDESVLQAAVNDKSGSITFYEIPETGISTGDEEIAQSHRARGFDVREIIVPCVTLSTIFNQVKQAKSAKAREIHWLKIDVEGMELQVLRGWGKHKARPWIVVVESTLPLTQVETHQAWEPCLFERGYTPVYFDGLNRYYLSPAHPELTAAFISGPNVFDGFVLNGTASAPFCARVNEKYKQAEQALQAQVAQSQQHIEACAKIDAALAEVSQQLRSAQEENVKYRTLESKLVAETSTLQGQDQQTNDESAQSEQGLQAQSAEALRQAQEQAQAHQVTLQQREQNLASQLEDLRVQMHQAEQAAAQREQALKKLASETHRQAQEQAQAHLNALARHHEASGNQLEALQMQIRQAQADVGLREQALQAQSASALQQAQDQAKAHLAMLAERETAFGQQLEALQTQMRQAQVDGEQREQALQAQSANALKQAQDQVKTHLDTLAERENAFTQQLQALQAEMHQSAEHADQREQDLRAQSAVALHAAQEKAETHLKALAAREQAFSGQIHELQAQMRQALEQAAQREQALQAQSASAIQEAQEKAHGHLKTLAEREQMFSQQLQELQAHMREANHGASQREQAFAQQLQARQAQVDEAQKTAAEQTRALHRQSAESVDQANAQIQTHLLALAHKEQAFGRELKELRQEMANDQSEASQRERSLRENATDAQQKANEQLAQRSEDWAQREKELAKEITSLHVEAQALHHAQQLQKQEHEFHLSARHEAQTHLIEKFAAFEAQLQSEMTLERQTSLLIRESLAVVQQNLSSTQASLAWRVSAPLRMLAGLISPQKALEVLPVAATPLPPSLPSAPYSSFVTSLLRPAAEESSQRNPAQHPAVASHQPAAAEAVNPPVSTAAAAIAQTGPIIESAPTFSKSPATPTQPAPVAPATMPPLQANHPTQPIQASSLDELLASDDQHFVHSAYLTVLGREPDPEGLGYSLGRLRQGVSKIKVLAQLRLSKEGNAFAVKLPGLDRAIHHYQQEQYPLIGWVFKRLHGAETNHPIERKLRAIENKLNFLSDESTRRFDQMEARLSEFSYSIGLNTSSTANALKESSSLEQSQRTGQLKKLTPRARAILFQLRTAIAEHGGRNA